MNKLKELLSKIDVPTALLCLFVAKCGITGTNIAEAIVVLSLSGVYGYKMFQTKKEVVRRSEFDRELETLKGEINGLKIGLNMKKAQDVQKKDKRYF